MIERAIPHGVWGDDGLGIEDAERVAPKARNQVCGKCRRTGFQTFEEAWTHKVECIPEDGEVQDWVRMKRAAEAVTDTTGSVPEVEMEDSTVGRSSDVVGMASVSQAKSRAQQEDEFEEMMRQDLGEDLEDQETHVWVECQCP